jgi:hypothetical protein
MSATDTQDHTGEKGDDRGGKIIHVTVSAPRSPTPKEFAWSRDMLVSEAAADAAAAFQYTGGTPALSEGDRWLDPDVSLHKAGVKNKDKLELSDRGGGV